MNEKNWYKSKITKVQQGAIAQTPVLRHFSQNFLNSPYNNKNNKCLYFLVSRTTTYPGGFIGITKAFQMRFSQITERDAG